LKTFKTISIFIILGIITITSTIQVQADIGPKRSLDVYIIGIDEDFYFDLLIKTNDAPILDQERINDAISYYTSEETIPDFFNGYQDSEGYASYTLYYPIGGGRIRQQSTTDNVIHYNVYYDVPNTFKIAIYMENGVLITSDIIETVFFDSSITYDLSNIDTTTTQHGIGEVTGDIKGNFPYTTMIFDITYRIILTLLIELLILYFFRYLKKSSYIVATITNIITQSILTIFLIVTFKYSGALAAFLLLFFGESLVFLIEIVVYMIGLREHSKLRAFFYAITANIVTLLITIILFSFII